MKKFSVFKLFVVLFCGILFFDGQVVLAQVEKGVTASGKEVDCTTIDPSTDKTVSEHGKIVTSPRVTRNGKLLDGDCGPSIVLSNFTYTDSTCTTATMRATIASGTVTSATVKIYDDAEYTSENATATGTATISGSTINVSISNLEPGTTYYIKLTGTDGVESNSIKKSITTPTPTAGNLTVSADQSIICSGSTAKLTASVTGNDGTLTYQWYKAASTISGATTTTYTTEALTATTNYKCVVTATKYGCTVTQEKPVTITVNNPTITGTMAINGTTAICSGSSTSLTATGLTASTGAELEYQWYKNDVIIDGATDAIYSTGNLTAGANYKCIAKAKQGSCESTAKQATVGVTVYSPSVGTYTLTATADTMCYGSKPTIVADVTGNNGTLTYQWTVAGEPIYHPSASYTQTYGISAKTVYNCVVTATVGGTCTASSSKSVTVAVTSPNPGTVTIHPIDARVCYGGSTTLSADAEGNKGTLTYQWYKNDVILTGETGKTYTTEGLTTSAVYKCEIVAHVDSCSSDVYTTLRSVTIDVPSLTSVTVNGNTPVCSGGTVSLSVTKSPVDATQSYKYQWYEGSTLLTGDTNATCIRTNVTSNKTYKCEVKAVKGNCVSSAVSGTKPIEVVTSTLTGVSIGSDTNICSGTTAHLNVTATGNGTLSYQWKKGSTNVGTNAATYTTEGLTATTTYSCVVTNNNGGCTTTATASKQVKVVTPSTGTVTVANAEICPGTNTTLTASVSGNNGALTYQWKQGATDISGATSYQYTTPNLDRTTGYAVVVTATTSTPATCSTSYMKLATVTVPNPVFDTLTICDCLLPYTWTKLGKTVIFEASDMVGHDTLTKTYDIGDCEDMGHVTLILWESNRERPTVCTNISNPVHQRVTEEHVSGTNLTSVTYNGYDYKVVQIGGQCWLKENLRTEYTPGGDTLLSATTQLSYTKNTYYKFEGTTYSLSPCDGNMTFAEHKAKYGLMYNWFSAMNHNNPPYGATNWQGLCPDGWHIPDTTEFQIMANEVGLYGRWSHIVPGNDDIHKQISTGDYAVRLATGCEWIESTVANSPGDYHAVGRNSSGFSARPSGCFNNTRSDELAEVYRIGDWAFFWSCTRQIPEEKPRAAAAFNYDLHPEWEGLSRDNNSNDQSIGRSIRCIRDKAYLKVRLDSSRALSSTSVKVSSNVWSLGDNACTERGICWSTSPNPIATGSHIANGSGQGAYDCTMTGLTSGIGYYVRAYATDVEGTIYSDEIKVYPIGYPEVATVKTVKQTSNSAYLVGDVETISAASATAGFYVGSTANPATEGTYYSATVTDEGEYRINVTGLSSNHTYYYCAHIDNGFGKDTGIVKSFVAGVCAGLDTIPDAEGHKYHVQAFGSACWITSGIYATQYSDGTPILKGTEKDGEHIAKFSTETAYYYPPYKDVTGTVGDAIARESVWGLLYNWQAASRGEMGECVQGVCPEGWHLPTRAEWQTLTASYTVKQLAGKNQWQSSTVAGAVGYGVLNNVNSNLLGVYGVGYYNGHNQYGSDDAALDHSAYHTFSCFGHSLVNNLWCGDGHDNPYFVQFSYNSASLIHGGGVAADFRNNAFQVRCVKD